MFACEACEDTNLTSFVSCLFVCLFVSLFLWFFVGFCLFLCLFVYEAKYQPNTTRIFHTWSSASASVKNDGSPGCSVVRSMILPFASSTMSLTALTSSL